MRTFAHPHRAAALAITALCAAVTLETPVAAQESSPATADEPAPDEEIVVLGKRLEELRIRIELAEDDVYARFNEINSNDLFDVHCYERAAAGSRIEKRTCLSNAWRQMDAAFADATVRDMQSSSAGVASGMDAAGSPSLAASAGYSHVPQKYRAKQLRTEGLVADEMRRLAREDPELRDAMLRLGQAYQAEESLTGSPPEWTLYREVTAGSEGLPFGAQHAFEVRIGSTEWGQTLSTRTFTITSVDGRIRGMRVDCDQAERKLDYQEGLDWTIPDSWGACTLYVSAKRGTTFALYEFR
jgi:hypothetical protein